MLCCFQVCVCVCVCVCVHTSACHFWLFATLWATLWSQTGSSVSGDSPGVNTEWVAMPSSRGSSQARDLMRISYVCCIGRQDFFMTSTTWEVHFQVYNKENCLCIYIYSFFIRFYAHMSHFGVLSSLCYTVNLFVVVAYLFLVRNLAFYSY